MLSPFDPADAPLVASWAVPGTGTLRWCGLPAVPAAVVAGWGRAAGVLAYGLRDGDRDGDRLVGYGELWLDDDEAEVELARIIVAPDRRGRGTGRRLAAALAELARAHHDEVFLRVHPDNEPALRCYLGAGFVPVDPAEAAEWNRGQPVPYAWLRAVPRPAG